MLSALAVYRSRNRPKSFQGMIAWLGNDHGGDSWRRVATSVDYFNGASSRAKTHGFNLEQFDLRTSATSPRRLAAIFRARNIQGLLLPPQVSENAEIEFLWENFSALTFGYSLVKPMLHTVTATQFRDAVQTMRGLKRHGYRRIGFVLAGSHDARTDHNYLAGYLVECHTAPAQTLIPPLWSYDRNQFCEWYQKHRPDAIMTGDLNMLELLRALRIDVPGDLGVACPLVGEENSPMAGVRDDSFHIGEVAVDFLVGMIQRGERGIPKNALRLHVEGVWHQGKTLRKV